LPKKVIFGGLLTAQNWRLKKFQGKIFGATKGTPYFTKKKKFFFAKREVRTLGKNWLENGGYCKMEKNSGDILKFEN